MTKNLLITSLLLSLCATTAFAAQSAEKVYKISVTLPAHVVIPQIGAAAETPAALSQGETTERLADNNQQVLLRTTVVK